MFKRIISIFSKDWATAIKEYWKNIDTVYKKSFLIIFLVLNLVFSFHTINFLWGNHDWGWIATRLETDDFFWCGRFTIMLIPQLFGGKILPVWNNIFGFMGLALSSIMLLKYWKVPKTVFNFTGLGILLTTMPYSLPWLFYIHQTTTCYWLPFIAILGLLLCEKAAQNKWLNIWAMLLIFFCLGAYPPIINTFAIVFLSKLLLERLATEKTFSSQLWQNRFVFINSAIAAILVKIIIHFMHLPAFAYNAEMIKSSDLVLKLLISIKASFAQFFIATHFITSTYKIVLFIIVILGLISFIRMLFKTKKLSYAAINIMLLLMIVFSTQLCAFLSSADVFFAPRIEFYGLVYFYVLSLVFLIIQNKIFYKNLTLLAFLVIIPMSCYYDLYAQKVWKFGFDAEMKLTDRIVARIENAPKFLPDKKYEFLQVGNRKPLRPNYYKYRTKEIKAYDLLDFNYLFPSTAYYGIDSYDFYYPTKYVQVYYDWVGYYSDLVIKKESVKGLNEYIFNKAKPWPHENSIYVDDNYIVVINSQEGLNALKEKLVK